MTAFINKLKDKTGNQQLPVTHERAVRDDNGTTLESKMQNLEGAMDKAYVASSDNGMGRITLKKNMVSGVNTLTQSMMQATNTIYVIQYDFTLGEDITVPANCILEFDGGSISGAYTITGNNTGIKAGLVKVFNTNVTIAGTWNVAEAYSEWFGAKGDGVNDDTDAIQKAIYLASLNSIKCCKLCSKQYYITTINVSASVELCGEYGRDRNTLDSGTVLKLFGDSNHHILLNNSSYIHDVSFYQPHIIDITYSGGEWTEEQISSSFTKFCIYAGTSKYVRIQNITFILVAKGIGFAEGQGNWHETAYIENVAGIPMYRGIVLGNSSDVDRIFHVQFNANYVANGSIFNDSIKNAVNRFTYKYGIALELSQLDGGIIDGFFCYGYYRGIETQTEAMDMLTISNSGFDACVRGINITHPSARIINCWLTSYDRWETGIKGDCCIHADSPGQIYIENCLLFGYDQNCIEGKNIYIDNCIIRASERKQAEDIDIILDDGINGITNCYFDLRKQYSTTRVIQILHDGYIKLSDNIFADHPSPTYGYFWNEGIIRGYNNIAINGGNIDTVRTEHLERIVRHRSTTAERPSDGSVVNYFDTTLKKPIWWEGDTTGGKSGWVDATGNPV